MPSHETAHQVGMSGSARPFPPALLVPGLRASRVGWDDFKIKAVDAWQLHYTRLRLLNLIRSRARAP